MLCSVRKYDYIFIAPRAGGPAHVLASPGQKTCLNDKIFHLWLVVGNALSSLAGSDPNAKSAKLTTAHSARILFQIRNWL